MPLYSSKPYLSEKSSKRGSVENRQLRGFNKITHINVSEHRRRKCKTAYAAKIEIARLALQGKFFHPPSTRAYSSRFRARHKVSHGNRAERIIIRIHKFAFSRVRSRGMCMHVHLPRIERIVSFGVCIFCIATRERANSRVVISIPCILFLSFFLRLSLSLYLSIYLSFFSPSFSLAISRGFHASVCVGDP